MAEWHLCKAGGAVVADEQGQTKRSPAVSVTERGGSNPQQFITFMSSTLHYYAPRYFFASKLSFFVTLWYGAPFRANAFDIVVFGPG